MWTNQRSDQWVLWVKKKQLCKKRRTFTQFPRGALAPETMGEEPCGHAPCWSRTMHHGLFLPLHTVRNGWSGQVMCLTSQSHGGGAWALPSPPRQPSSAHGGSCGLSFPLPHSILPPSPHSSPSPLPPSPSFLPILPFPLLWMHLWVSVNRNWDREICLALFGNLLFPHLSFLCSAFIKHSAKHLTTNVRKSDKPPPPPLPPNMQVSLAWLSRQPWAGTMMVDKAGGLPIEEHTLRPAVSLLWASGFSHGTPWTEAQQYQILPIGNYKTKQNKQTKKSGLLWASPMEQRK